MSFRSIIKWVFLPIWVVGISTNVVSDKIFGLWWFGAATVIGLQILVFPVEGTLDAIAMLCGCTIMTVFIWTLRIGGRPDESVGAIFVTGADQLVALMTAVIACLFFVIWFTQVITLNDYGVVFLMLGWFYSCIAAAKNGWLYGDGTTTYTRGQTHEW